MSIVVDPDNLDRFNVAVDPTNEEISIRALGADRTAKSTAGDVTGASSFEALGETFQSAGDILAIVSGTNIGHYTVATVPTQTTLTINETFPDTGEAAGQTFKIAPAKAQGGAAENLADGVTLQALYSFLKEEWRTLSDADMPDLIKFTYPLESITREQFEIGGSTHSDWNFKDATTKELIRTGGWQKKNASGNVIQDYAGVISLGSIDTDAQVYYQQHATSADPTDFVLTGVVNQAINTFDEVTGPDAVTGFAITGANTITRNDGGNWWTDGYRPGGQITIRNAEDSGNNGTWTISSVQDATDGDLVVTGALTNNAADTTMIAAVNKRSYLRLFVRKKAKSYPGLTDLATIGVSSIETLVNRFPLAHVDDPAILLDDGEMSGDGTNDVFQEVETHDSGTNGATTDGGNGTFTFDAVADTPTFNDGVLQVGDTVELTSGNNQGVYEIVSITDADTLVLYKEPTASMTFGETGLSWTSRTGTRDAGTSTGVLTDEGSGVGRLDDAGATFTTDDGLGDRTVAVGDFLLVTAGSADAVGVYKITDVRDADTLELDISDADWSGGPYSTQTYIVKRPGMHLQYFQTETAVIGPFPTATQGFDFNDADPDTIDRNDPAGSFITDGFEEGMAVRVLNSETPANNTVYPDGYIIDASGVAATTLTLISQETLTAGTDDNTATLQAEKGIVRIPNTVSGEPYPFHWRLFGNGGTLAQCFQWLQKKLRRAVDIDEGDATARGDVTDLLMTFASPNGVGLDMYIDDLAAADKNNFAFTDITGDSRNFPFLAGVTITPNDNLLNDSSAKIVVFFEDPDGTPGNGDEFGTVGAIIVKDDQLVDAVDTTPLSNPFQFTFDYENNNQGGRTPNTDADIVIVGIGLETAQYVQLGSIAIEKQNNNPFSLVASLERNYSNP